MRAPCEVSGAVVQAALAGDGWAGESPLRFEAARSAQRRLNGQLHLGGTVVGVVLEPEGVAGWLTTIP